MKNNSVTVQTFNSALVWKWEKVVQTTRACYHGISWKRRVHELRSFALRGNKMTSVLFCFLCFSAFLLNSPTSCSAWYPIRQFNWKNLYGSFFKYFRLLTFPLALGLIACKCVACNLSPVRAHSRSQRWGEKKGECTFTRLFIYEIICLG